jgi:hypothetical protein
VVREINFIHQKHAKLGTNRNTNKQPREATGIYHPLRHRYHHYCHFCHFCHHCMPYYEPITTRRGEVEFNY